MIGLHVTTLGCKLNQLDTAELSGDLRGSVTPVSDPGLARLVIVNTCTVTGAADADARKLLRRRRRESPTALIVATGCLAERDPGSLRALPEVDLVLERAQRPDAARIILDRLRDRFPSAMADGCADRAVGESLPDFGSRSRASLRVQEGCDLRCSYCVIPRVRGASRSVDPSDLTRRLRRLAEAGFKEIVLTGVNTGDYGKDLASGTSLADLLRRLVRVEGEFRIRLNSVEPRCVTPDLIEAIAESPRIARHLQIPLQSGSDRVLRGMRRNYRTSDYARVMETLRSRMPEIGLGADVIVGFPAEGEPEFAETVRFVRSMPLNYLHVFSYSSRPGTDAASMPGHVDRAAVRKRSAVLRRAGADLSLAFRKSQAGRRIEALVFEERRADGRRRALTTNFIDVSLDGEAAGNSLVDVTITAVDGPETIAIPG